MCGEGIIPLYRHVAGPDLDFTVVGGEIARKCKALARCLQRLGHGKVVRQIPTKVDNRFRIWLLDLGSVGASALIGSDMVDSELRTELREDVRRLYAGLMPRQDFEEAFYFRYASTDDQAIREVANLCAKIASGKTPNPTSDPDKSKRNKAALMRSMLFLNSNLDYEWPGDSVSPGHRTVVGLTLFLILPVIMAVVLFWLPIPVAISEEFTTPLALVGVAGMFGALCLICYQPESLHRQKDLLSGKDPELWPFRRVDDLQQVATRCHVAHEFVQHRI
jgi:hypothetical protein